MKFRATENGFRKSATKRAFCSMLFTAVIVATFALRHLPIWVSSYEQHEHQLQRQQPGRANIGNATASGGELGGSCCAKSYLFASNSQKPLERGERVAASVGDNHLNEAESKLELVAPNTSSELVKEANLGDNLATDSSSGAQDAGMAGLAQAGDDTIGASAADMDTGSLETSEADVEIDSGGDETVYRELASFEGALLSDAIYYPSSDELVEPAHTLPPPPQLSHSSDHAAATESVAGQQAQRTPAQSGGPISAAAESIQKGAVVGQASSSTTSTAAGTARDGPNAAYATESSSSQGLLASVAAPASSMIKGGRSGGETGSTGNISVNAGSMERARHQQQLNQMSKVAAEETRSAFTTLSTTSKSKSTTTSTSTANTNTTTGVSATLPLTLSSADSTPNGNENNNNNADKDYGGAGEVDINSPSSISSGIRENQRDSYCLGKHDPDGTFKWDCMGLQLIKVPVDLDPKPMILRFENTGIESLRRHSLQNYRATLRGFSVEKAPNLLIIEEGSFENLIKLRVVYIFKAPKLVSFDLAVSGSLPDLDVIRIQQTGLGRWPKTFKQDRILSSVDLDNNNITSLGSQPVNIRTGFLNLEFNYIESIDEVTFNGSEIATLSLSGNRKLSFIHQNAFANLQNLITLDLSNTSVVQLPSIGFHQLRNLYIRDTPALKRIPSIYMFPMLERAHLTYAYHCCSFRYPKTHDPSAHEKHLRDQEEINALCANRRDDVALSNAEDSQVHSSSSEFEGYFDAVQKMPSAPGVKVNLGVGSGGNSSSLPTLSASQQTTTSLSQPKPPAQGSRLIGTSGGRLAAEQSAQFTAGASSAQTNRSQLVIDSSLKKLLLSHTFDCGELAINGGGQNINCTPEPTAFEPCEGIMGYSMLRVAVWFVVGASVFGNLSVIVVLMGVFRRLSVPKFLQLNLAIGDLFMGVYLAMLAFADLTTVGVYFNYAIEWQHGYGCKIAGAVSLFASQLSIFTLSVITFERYYTITYSIDLNMRLQLGWAARIMFLGWIYAFTSAMLPIFADINSYTMTSICLPIRTTYLVDRIFIVVLLSIDASAFVIILACYLKMYLLIVRQKTEATAKERTVAMRMALLVSTDFACWAPIIFFGTTAFFGHPLISLTNSKILIVFFYPLNSMANPFLYVISTRQYRRDLNYLTSRWQIWRKNLFKKNNDSFYSNNAAYGAAQYPPGSLNAHLGAVAAVTGVANHLRHNHIGVPINAGGNYAGVGVAGALGGVMNATNGNHHHPNGGSANCALNSIKLHEQRVVCTKSHQGQYIIRHQILTDRHMAGATGRNDTRGSRSARCHFSRPTTQAATCGVARELPPTPQQRSSLQAGPKKVQTAATALVTPTRTKHQIGCGSGSGNNLTVITATTGANDIIRSTKIVNISDTSFVANGGQSCNHHEAADARMMVEGSPAPLFMNAISDETTSEARNFDEKASSNDNGNDIVSSANHGSMSIEGTRPTIDEYGHNHGHAHKRYSVCCTTTTVEGQGSLQIGSDNLQSEGKLGRRHHQHRSRMADLKSSIQQSLSIGATATSTTITTTAKKMSQLKMATCKNCGYKFCSSCFSPVIGAPRNSLSPYCGSQSSSAAHRRKLSQVCPVSKTRAVVKAATSSCQHLPMTSQTTVSQTALTVATTTSQLLNCSDVVANQRCLPNGSNSPIKSATNIIYVSRRRRQRCLCRLNTNNNLLIVGQLDDYDELQRVDAQGDQQQAAPASVAAASSSGRQRQAIDILGNLSNNEPTSSVSGISTPPQVEPLQEVTTMNTDSLPYGSKHLAATLDNAMIELSELSQQQQLKNRGNQKHHCHHHHQHAHRYRGCRLKSRSSRYADSSLQLDAPTKERKDLFSSSTDKAAAAAVAGNNSAISSERLDSNLLTNASETLEQPERELGDEQQANGFIDSHRCNHNHHHHHHRHEHLRRRHHNHEDLQQHERQRDDREQREQQRRPCLRRRELLERSCEIRGWSSQDASRNSSQSQVEICEKQTELDVVCVDNCDADSKKEEKNDNKTAADEFSAASVNTMTEAAYGMTTSRSRVITPQASVISENHHHNQQQQPRKELESILKQSPQRQQQPKTAAEHRLLRLFKGGYFQNGHDDGDENGANRRQRGSQKGRHKRVSIMASHHSG